MLRLRAVWTAALCVGTLSADGPKGKIDFARDVRPILSDKCFLCHGPDAGHRKADLRLDQKEKAFAAGESGAVAIKPGKPDESELVRRILADDADERMPPASSKKQLTDAEKKTLRDWIAQGAEWGGHWAFTAPTRPAVPTVKNQEWVKNPIDAFIMERLERQRLSPSPPADKRTLLRRLSLDLVGLPPSKEATDRFLADFSPNAWSKEIESLLDSPHYGERWGRWWLDAARYADSDGFEKDKLRQVWLYRDWVVTAFNCDLPYDRFVVEQIAGDMLPNATVDQRIATGFLRNSMINEEGGVDPEQFRMEAMFDRMDAVGKSVLGLTIQCAQCHTHKFDPITQEDYYRMFACLNNSHEACVPVLGAEDQAKRDAVLAEITKIEDELKAKRPKWRDEMAKWEKTVPPPKTPWTTLRFTVDDISTGGQKYLPMEDGSFLAQSYAPTKHTVVMTTKTPMETIAALRLDVMTDPNLPLGGPGRSIVGSGALTEFEVEAAPANDPDKKKRVKIGTATADFNAPERPLEEMFNDRSPKKRVVGPLAFALDGKDETAWTTDAGPGRRGIPRHAVFTFAKPITNKGGTILVVKLKQNHGGWNSDDNQNCNLGRIKISATTDANVAADKVPADVRAVLMAPTKKRSPKQEGVLFSHWRTTIPAWKDANERIEALWKTHPQEATQLVLMERDKRRPTHLLERGDFLKPKQEVKPGTPGFLHASSAVGRFDRLAFAKWLVDRKSPTTARAIVNRVWLAYFGQGLVSSPEDLGSQSEPPSHPELLDWLAVEFMESGWSFKNLHRLIVTSNTYRQSSKATPELLSIDPYNRLLARGPRFRVDAETLRDVALFASGVINLKLGGPSVFPPAPGFLFQPPTSYGPKVWPESKGADRYRRALYTFRYRSVPFPMLQNFDAPNGDASCICRSRSNTPQQALTTLNEPLFMECARALAKLTLEQGGSMDDGRLALAFERCTNRPPTAKEKMILAAFLDKELKRFNEKDARPWDLAADDPKRPPPLPGGVTPAQLAAWTATARVLLNLDETLVKE
jgi:hypothetical protein